MNLLDIIFIGVGLSMDAFAITIANCISYKKTLNKRQEWSMPVLFAIFQGVMPLIGFLIGSLFFSYIEPFAKYITSSIFFALAIKIGIDIIKDFVSNKEENSAKKFSIALVFLQAVATSIDALVIGITLTSAVVSIWISILVISLVTFLFVVIALFIGKNLGLLLGKYANYVSLAIMLFLAIKSLF